MIRKNNDFALSPILLFNKMKLIRRQPDEIQQLARKVVQRNGWPAEKGIFLCAMLSSGDREVRAKAVDVISASRITPPKKPATKILGGIRKLEVPELNWEADHWSEIVSLKEGEKVHVPSIISKITDEELKKILENHFNFPKFPLHSTSVERAVKLVSEASGKVFGYEARHRHILSKVSSRKQMPDFKTKSKFSLI